MPQRQTAHTMSNTSSVNVRNRPHFTLINLFHYYTWRNYFGNSPKTKAPPVRYSLCGLLPPCSSTQILSWCHGEKYTPWGSNFLPSNEKKKKKKKNTPSMPPLLLISHFLLSSSRQVWLLLCYCTAWMC